MGSYEKPREIAMRYLAAVTAVTLVVAGCDQGTSTGPSDGSRPQFASTTSVSISGKGTATQLSNFTIVTEASFNCPEGETALINVKVDQPSTTTTGSGAVLEACKVGPNNVVVEVNGIGKGLGWDIAKADAVFSISTESSKGVVDAKEITIKAP